MRHTRQTARKEPSITTKNSRMLSSSVRSEKNKEIQSRTSGSTRESDGPYKTETSDPKSSIVDGEGEPANVSFTTKSGSQETAFTVEM
jgi:hypothetical protein